MPLYLLFSWSKLAQFEMSFKEGEKKNHYYGWLLKKEMKQMCYGLMLKLESNSLYIAWLQMIEKLMYRAFIGLLIH